MQCDYCYGEHGTWRCPKLAGRSNVKTMTPAAIMGRQPKVERAEVEGKAVYRVRVGGVITSVHKTKEGAFHAAGWL